MAKHSVTDTDKGAMADDIRKSMETASVEVGKQANVNPVVAQQAADQAPTPETPETPIQAAKSTQARMAALKEEHETIPLRINHEDVDMPVDDVVRLAQKGWKANDLDERITQVQSDAQGFGAFKQFQQWLVTNPDKAQRIQGIYEGREAPPEPQAPSNYDSGWDSDDSYEAPASPGSQVVSDLQARLQRLESEVNQTSSRVNQRDFEGQMADAIGRQPFLSANPDARDTAQGMIASLISSGEFHSPSDAAPVVATRLQRMVEAEMDRIRTQRETQQNMTSVPPGSGSPTLAPVPSDGISPGVKGLRDGSAKSAIKDWIRKGISSQNTV